MERPLMLEPGNRSASAALVVRLVADYPVKGRSSYGLQPVYYNLSKTQAKDGHRVHVLARRMAGQPAEEDFEGVHVSRLQSPYSINAIAKMRELIVPGTPSVIHTHSSSGAFLVATKKSFSAPIVSHVHGTTYSAATPANLEFGKIGSYYSKWRVTTSYLREKSLWSKADAIAAVSSSVKSDLISRYDIKEGKIRLVYNGVDSDVFKPTPPSAIPGVPSLEGKKVVLYVGHFGLRKGVPYLIRAMRTVCQKHRDAVLLCVGGVPPWLPKGQYIEYLNNIVAENGLHGKVFLSDRIDNELLPSVYSLARAFVLPSYYEAFPKVLIEAMACEIPVITTNLGGTSDSVQEGVNGYLVPYADPATTADRIDSLLGDESLARKMGREGRNRVVRDFTWDAVARRIDSLYAAVLQET